jgi:energy-converting hydrogenase Eha subunit E
MKQPIRKTAAFLSIVMTLTAAISPAWAGDPAEDLKQIEYKYYFRGKYPQAIDALQTFLARVDVTGPVAVRASEFLAASHVLSGAPQTGKDVFTRLITADPAYAGPDAGVFKPEVVDVYAQARSEYAALTLKNPAIASADSTQAPAGATPNPAATQATSKPIYKKWWFYAGAAAVVGVVAGLAGGGGGNDAPPPASGSVSVGVVVH